MKGGEDNDDDGNCEGDDGGMQHKGIGGVIIEQRYKIMRIRES